MDIVKLIESLLIFLITIQPILLLLVTIFTSVIAFISYRNSRLFQLNQEKLEIQNLKKTINCTFYECISAQRDYITSLQGTIFKIEDLDSPSLKNELVKYEIELSSEKDELLKLEEKYNDLLDVLDKPDISIESVTKMLHEVERNKLTFITTFNQQKESNERTYNVFKELVGIKKTTIADYEDLLEELKRLN